MRSLYITCCVFLASFCAVQIAQAQQNVLATGGEANGTDGQVSFSVGQIDFATVSGADAVLTEGVQQPYEFFTIGVEELEDIELIASVFPNPARFDVNLLVHLPGYAQLHWTLFDSRGQLVRSSSILQPQTLLPVADLAAGTYLLEVSDQERMLKSFRIIKNN